ncbi:tRNA lysidine(34) synthetase TilS [bacterium]|nr:tRNA lysidine(34) synthetase TilS [bacterium]
MGELLPAFERFALNGLIRPSDRILIGVSGGVDSMVLMDLFLRIQDRHGLFLAVAHVNHGLRHEESDRDERFVKEQSESRKLPFFVRRVDAKAHAEQYGLSIEEAARDLRFESLSDIARSEKMDRIALGHHLDDQAETVLLNLMRGAGLAGLCGIRALRLPVIHPLLFAAKAELLEYAASRGLTSVQDQTNFDRGLRRNWVRHELIPAMQRKAGPGVSKRIARAAQTLQETYDLIEHLAQAASADAVRRETDQIFLDIVKFFNYFKSIQIHILNGIYQDLAGAGKKLDYHEIQDIFRLACAGRSGRIRDLKGGIRVVRSGRHLIFFIQYPDFSPLPVLAGETVMVPELGGAFRSELIAEPVLTTNPLEECLDFDRVGETLQIRTFRRGDRFMPLGLKRKKKVHDFFIDEQVPVHRRTRIPLLVRGEDIVWIIGMRLDERFKITDRTSRILKVEWSP